MFAPQASKIRSPSRPSIAINAKSWRLPDSRVGICQSSEPSYFFDQLTVGRNSKNGQARGSRFATPQS